MILNSHFLASTSQLLGLQPHATMHARLGIFFTWQTSTLSTKLHPPTIVYYVFQHFSLIFKDLFILCT